jgi:hypothetical protein
MQALSQLSYTPLQVSSPEFYTENSGASQTLEHALAQ